jgi:hypothetical protein
MSNTQPPLTAKERRFLEEYLVDHDMRRAAEVAGLEPDLAAAIGARLTIDRVRQELAAMAFASAADYVEVRRDGALRLDVARLIRDRAPVDLTFEAPRKGRGGLRLKKVTVNGRNRVAALSALARLPAARKKRPAESEPVTLARVPVASSLTDAGDEAIWTDPRLLVRRSRRPT